MNLPRQPHTDVQHMSRGGWKDYGRAGERPLCSPYDDSPLGASLSTRPLSPAGELGLFTRHLASKRVKRDGKALEAEARGSHSLPALPSLLFKARHRVNSDHRAEIETLDSPDEGRGQVPTRMGEILLAFLADILCTNKVLVSKIGKELLGFIKKETLRK